MDSMSEQIRKAMGLTTFIISLGAGIVGLSGVALFVLLCMLIVGFCTTKELYGYVDRTGRFVIPPQFVTAENFSSGKANVVVLAPGYDTCNTFQMGVINLEGKLTLKGPDPSQCFNELSFRPDEDNPVSRGQVYTGDQSPEGIKIQTEFLSYHYKNRDSDEFIPPKFTEVSYFNNGVAWASSSEKAPKLWGLINRNGDYLLAPKCSAVGEFHEGLARCRVTAVFGKFY